MPKSKLRKKVKATRAYKSEHPEIEELSGPSESPAWLAKVMVAGFLIGLLWIVTFYVTTATIGKSYPIPNIGTWNMLVGFGFIGIGFGLATRWR